MGSIRFVQDQMDARGVGCALIQDLTGHDVSLPLPVVAAEVREGSRFDAFRYSLSANTAYGLRRTNADKRHSVILAFGEKMLRDSSDHVLAELCGVGHHLVAAVRCERSQIDGSQLGVSPNSPLPAKRKGRDGKLYASTRPKRSDKPVAQGNSPVAPEASDLLQVDKGNMSASLSADAVVESKEQILHDEPPVRNVESMEPGCSAEDTGSMGDGAMLPATDAVTLTGEVAPETVTSDATVILPASVVSVPEAASSQVTRQGSENYDQPPTTSSNWNDGIIGSARVQERLAKTNELHPSNRYTEQQQQAFKDCFVALVQAVNRVAEETCAAQSVPRRVAAETAIALGKFISTSPEIGN